MLLSFCLGFALFGNKFLIIQKKKKQKKQKKKKDTIFHLICNDVRLRISGLQKVVDSPANRSMCERWSFPLNILSPGGLAT